jgi:Ca2+-binding RTX toxin-like protein
VGHDTLIGGAGADRLDGGAGADRMEGGADDDTFLVDELGDAVAGLLGAGYDRGQACPDPG